MIQETIAGVLVAAVIVLVAAAVVFSSPVRAGECVNMVASHYGKESGNRTASGTFFDGSQMVAAHKTLPFGARLLVSYKGSKPVEVVIADRGPFVRGRDIDLSTAAARKIGLTKAGVGRVRVCRVG